MVASFCKVIKAFDDGDPVDLSQIPPPPPGYTSNYHLDHIMVTCTCSHECNAPTKHTQLFHSLLMAVLCQCLNPEVSLVVPTCVSQQVKKVYGQPTSEEGNESSVDPDIPIPKSTQEALEQRLRKYQSGVESAQKEGNSGKARRMGRIVKQYEDALKALEAGKPVDFLHLPTPPGYPPIPVSVPAKPRPVAVPVQESAGAVSIAKPEKPIGTMAQGHGRSRPAEGHDRSSPAEWPGSYGRAEVCTLCACVWCIQ